MENTPKSVTAAEEAEVNDPHRGRSCLLLRRALTEGAARSNEDVYFKVSALLRLGNVARAKATYHPLSATTTRP